MAIRAMQSKGILVLDSNSINFALQAVVSGSVNNLILFENNFMNYAKIYDTIIERKKQIYQQVM